ncbi:hypothetical protein QBC46DRAFT_397914 [Diplogelasinospora grovesii]|uniref:Uncharacterized protein n=1 Tax=Diplogelasinospora grovesii TaxID=303347 RepID=A0AAN6S070_9PEZI|nr:hypothetical protein QBC46DRAFT_397914 [Diplogelasinospora grovesii]
MISNSFSTCFCLCTRACFIVSCVVCISCRVNWCLSVLFQTLFLVGHLCGVAIVELRNVSATV